MARNLYDTFRENVEELLSERKMSRADLARRLKVTNSYISQILGGHRNPGFESLADFAKVFGVDPADLLKKPAKMA